MILMSGLESLLGWERLLLYGGYVEMIKLLIKKSALSCR
jgi:hypothetical protein